MKPASFNEIVAKIINLWVEMFICSGALKQSSAISEFEQSPG